MAKHKLYSVAHPVFANREVPAYHMDSTHVVQDTDAQTHPYFVRHLDGVSFVHAEGITTAGVIARDKFGVSATLVI